MIDVIRAEWLKIRSARFTAWTLLLTLPLSVGLACLIGVSFRSTFADRSAERQENFDPLFATFYSLTLAQLALVTFGVLVVGSEYSTGTIRLGLMATPRRGLFYAGKVAAVALTVLGFSLVTVLGTFLAAQVALGPYDTSLAADDALSATVGGWLYMTLICLFAVGLATITRSSTRALAILLPVLFLGSQGLGNIPYVRQVAQYLPDQAGMVIMHVAGPPNDGAFARAYGPWAGLGILALWTTATLIGGWFALRRDT